VVEPVRLAPSRLLFDVTRVASLRKGLGYPATALKIIGFWSAIFLGAYLSDLVGLAFAVIVTLLTPGCASLIAKRLRSGCTWAVAWAVIWWVLFAAFLVGDFFSKHQEISGYSIFFAALVVAPLYFLARGMFAFVAYRAEKRNGRSLTDPLALNPYEEGLARKCDRPTPLLQTISMVCAQKRAKFGLGGPARLVHQQLAARARGSAEVPVAVAARLCVRR
jgi:uncharacterized membrane protein YGL010W